VWYGNDDGEVTCSVFDVSCGVEVGVARDILSYGYINPKAKEEGKYCL